MSAFLNFEVVGASLKRKQMEDIDPAKRGDVTESAGTQVAKEGDYQPASEPQIKANEETRAAEGGAHKYLEDVDHLYDAGTGIPSPSRNSAGPSAGPSVSAFRLLR